ncbi:MAG: Holliday junction resolvase-like protein [candidate division WOR-3 bacterium]
MKPDIIKELKSNCNLYAECSTCGSSFQLNKAIIFYVDGPIPDEAKKIINKKENDLFKRKKELINRRKKLKERAEKATISVNLGKILEKVAPAIKGFKYNHRDCRALFEPIDYLVFNGLSTKNGYIDSMLFIDIKTGQASLNYHQKQIKAAVENGKVFWDTYGGKL